MKKVLTTLMLVFAMVGFVGLTPSPAGAATTSVYCDPAYTNWLGAPGSERATCPTAAARAPLPVYCNPAYTAWIGAPGSEGATCPGLVASHGNTVRN
jgi:hypothetical protein